MKMPLRPIALVLGFTLLATLQRGQARGEDSVQPSWNPNAAVKYLDGRGGYWLNWSSAARGQGTVCISCHTTLPFALARAALGERLGEKEAGAVEKGLIDRLKKRVDNWDKLVAEPAAGKEPFVPFYPKHMKPSSLGTESVLNALVLVNYDVRRAKGVLSESSMKALTHLWGQQKENGAWLWLDFGLRPWETEGTYYGASLAALAVGMAGKDYYEHADVQPKVAALKKYLITQLPSQRLHHRMVALWASSRLPGFLTEQDKKKIVEEILDSQAADGGWTLSKLGKYTSAKGEWNSQGAAQKGTASDGYATGLAVLTLKTSGLTADNSKLKKGIGWLVVQQQQEGTWPALYLNKPRDPETNVGKFMRDASTGFAILGLTAAN